MAWEYFDVNGSFWSTSTAKLKLDAAIGYINRDTEVVSTTTGKRGPAGEIKGLVFPESPPLIEPIAPPIEQVRPEAGFKFEPRKVLLDGVLGGVLDDDRSDCFGGLCGIIPHSGLPQGNLGTIGAKWTVKRSGRKSRKWR